MIAAPRETTLDEEERIERMDEPEGMVITDPEAVPEYVELDEPVTQTEGS